MRKTFLSLFTFLLVSIPGPASASSDESLDNFYKHIEHNLSQMDVLNERLAFSAVGVVVLEVLHTFSLAAAKRYGKKILHIEDKSFSKIIFPSELKENAIETLSQQGYQMAYISVVDQLFDKLAAPTNSACKKEVRRLKQFKTFSHPEQALAIYLAASDEGLKRFLVSADLVYAKTLAKLLIFDL